MLVLTNEEVTMDSHKHITRYQVINRTIKWHQWGLQKETGLNVSGMDRLGCVRAAIAERQIYPIFVSDVLFGRVVALKYFESDHSEIVRVTTPYFWEKNFN